jgi:type VI secretion system secreted protein VgrG
MTENVRLSLDGLDDATILRVVGREAMNELSELTVDVVSLHDDIDVGGLVQRSAGLLLEDAGGRTAQFDLAVVRAMRRGPFRGGQEYRIVLGSAVARLLWRVNHEIFQDKTTQEIVALLLERSGLSASRIKWRLQGRYVKRTYTVQYGESDWQFMSRLLADDGINYWFDTAGDDDVLVIGDDATSHESIAGDYPLLPFEETSGMVARWPGFHALWRRWSLAPTKTSIRDVNVQNPALPIDADAGDGALAIFEYPSGVLIPDAAKARARVRLQQLTRHRATLEGESGNAHVRPGRIVEIAGAADDCFTGKFLVTSVQHMLVAAWHQGRPYVNRATLVPFVRDAPYRPAPPTRRPVVDGLESAIVTGPSGQEIHVDDLGRVKVRFFWDRSKVVDDKSSRWVRTLQMNLVSPQVLPRVGWEVAVVYENGDPDRPFVLGRLYNGGAPPPYALPAKKATSTLQSATSPGDGTTQEVRLGDDKGSEEVFVHATKDQTVLVGGSHTVRVSGNRSDDVQKTQTLKVDSSQTTAISGNQKVSVGADGTIVVQGGRAEVIGANESVGVTGTYSVDAKGAYVEHVGVVYSLRCNQANATVQGRFTQTIGAALSTTAGLGSNQSVAGARTEVVGAARSFAAATTYADGTTGLKRISAGAASETAGGAMAFTARGRMQLAAGGAMSIQGAGKVVFEAPSITVQAATLEAKGGSTMKLSGSLSSSSTVKLDAPSVKKTDTAKVEG